MLTGYTVRPEDCDIYGHVNYLSCQRILGRAARHAIAGSGAYGALHACESHFSYDKELLPGQALEITSVVTHHRALWLVEQGIRCNGITTTTAEWLVAGAESGTPGGNELEIAVDRERMRLLQRLGFSLVEMKAVNLGYVVKEISYAASQPLIGDVMMASRVLESFAEQVSAGRKSFARLPVVYEAYQGGSLVARAESVSCFLDLKTRKARGVPAHILDSVRLCNS